MTDSEINRLCSLLNTLRRLEHGEIRTQDGSGLDTTDHNLKLFRQKFDELIQALTEQQLLHGGQLTAGEPADRYTGALSAEIERRNTQT